MSILGIIAVFKCDGCGKLKSVHTDADHEDLLHTWNVGKRNDHCPACFSTARRFDQPQDSDLTIERIVALVSRRISSVSGLSSPVSGLSEKEAA